MGVELISILEHDPNFMASYKERKLYSNELVNLRTFKCSYCGSTYRQGIKGIPQRCDSCGAAALIEV